MSKKGDGSYRQWGRDFRKRLHDLAVNNPSDTNSVQVYFDADLVYGAQLAAIAAAKEQVLVEMYMFLSDHVGNMFADALIAAARRGVSVKVIYDAVGSSDTDSEMFERMREAGADVVEFRPVAPWRKGSGILGRDHRKIIVVDNAVGFAGGVNLGDPWSRTVFGDDAWRDTHIRLTGPVVCDLQMLVAEVWEVATGEELNPLPCPEGTGKVSCVVIGGRGLRSRRVIRDAFLSELGQAKETVEITMPYFMPTRKLLRGMLEVVGRGVQVDLLVPRNSDVKIADIVRDGIYDELLEHGVRIWEYLGPVLHAKSVLIDNKRAMIGSSNFDFLSIAMNREMVVVMEDDDVVRDLQLQFVGDALISDRVRESHAQKRSWARRIVSIVLARLLKKLF